jgi:hypothetical protein
VKAIDRPIFVLAVWISVGNATPEALATFLHELARLGSGRPRQ